MIVKPSLRAQIMRKQLSMAEEKEERVKLTLAVSAKEDLMLDID